MLESLRQASTLQQGLFVTAAGIIGVFLVLILFYTSIIVIGKLFPYKGEQQ